MKRREFLTIAGAAGISLPAALQAQVRPCPPPSMTAANGTTTTTGCGTAGSVGTAPDWFVQMADRTWVTKGANTLFDVRPNPVPRGSTGQASVTAAYTGGCVDQVRGELILANNGGHTDYYGNEVYAIALRDANPRWVRLTDPTPDSQVTDPVNASNGDYAYLDGNPRSVHGWNRCVFAQGRVWYVGLSGLAAGNSGDSTAIFSFDRDAAGAGPFPIASSRAPWTFHGLSFNPLPANTDGWRMEAAPCAYDRVTNKVWALANTSYISPDKHIWSYDVGTGAIAVFDRKVGNPAFGSQWAVVAHNVSPRVLIVSEYSTSRIWLLNLENPSAGMVIKETGVANGIGAGAVYHAASRAILVWNEDGSSVRRLQVPADPINGAYTWSTITPGTGNTVSPSIPAPYAGTYGKFNMIEDMGNGQSALVLVTNTQGPVYVYKIPAAGV